MTDDISSRILYLSDACAVINKLGGEAVEGAGRGMGDLPRMLASSLAAKNGAAGSGADPDKLIIPAAVHRLDVPVTGCAAFALTRPALRFLNGVFSRQSGLSADSPAPAVRKQYWAIVEAPSGEMPVPDAGTLSHWILFDSRKNKSAAHDGPGPGRKQAVLTYRLAGKGRNYLFFDIELVTGRHHQIRAQFARLGLHIKGDLKYGARRSEKNGGIRLHARSLSFPDPLVQGGRISVRAEVPLQDNLWQAFAETPGV
jgi:23S rRNA pseudouridine1911/1915/1917 synthase